jgi:preprotein translocase subunit SecD
VLGVDVDKALEAQVERAGDTVRGELEKKGIAVSKIERRGISDLAIQIASPQSWDSALTTATEVLGAFDRKEADQAAGRIVMTLKPREATQIRELAVRQGLETIRNRVDQFGVAEPSIQQQGENRILVQLPGVQDPGRAKALIGKTALLEFKLVDDKVDPESALRSGVPDGDEVLYQRRVDKETHQERKVPFVVQKKAYVTGRDVATARVSIEAGVTFGWRRWVGDRGITLGLDAYGASAPAEVLFEKLGFTAQRVVEAVKQLVRTGPASA